MPNPLDESPTTGNPAEGQELAAERATLMTLLDAVIAEPLSFSPSAMVGIFLKARDVLSADYDYSALRTRPTEPVAGSKCRSGEGICAFCVMVDDFEGRIATGGVVCVPEALYRNVLSALQSIGPRTLPEDGK